MSNLQRRLRKLEALLTDDAGLVPGTPQWLSHWTERADQIFRGDNESAASESRSKSSMPSTGSKLLNPAQRDCLNETLMYSTRAAYKFRIPSSRALDSRSSSFRSTIRRWAVTPSTSAAAITRSIYSVRFRSSSVSPRSIVIHLTGKLARRVTTRSNLTHAVDYSDRQNCV